MFEDLKMLKLLLEYILSSIDCLQLYIHQTFLTFLVNEIIIDQWNQTATVQIFVVVVRIFNATRHPRHIEAAAIAMM